MTKLSALGKCMFKKMKRSQRHTDKGGGGVTTDEGGLLLGQMPPS